MYKKQCNIHIYAHWIELSQPTSIGTLHATPIPGKEIFSFEYDHEWLQNYPVCIPTPSEQQFR